MHSIIVKKHQVTEQRIKRIAGDESAAPEAQVRLLREGGVLRALEVRCSCGERLTVELDYDSPIQAAD